jgi:hypothetical protein
MSLFSIGFLEDRGDIKPLQDRNVKGRLDIQHLQDITIGGQIGHSAS